MPQKKRPGQRAVMAGLIIIGILFTAFFGMRAVHAFRKFNGHRPPPPGNVETDVELIRDWMTISFISKTYYVPEKIIFDALDILPLSNHDKSLKVLNKEYYPEKSGYVLSLVKKTILTNQPPLKPDPPLTPTASPPVAP